MELTQADILQQKTEDELASVFEQAVANMGPRTLRIFLEALNEIHPEAAELFTAYRAGQKVTSDQLSIILHAIKKDPELAKQFSALNPKLNDSFRRDGVQISMGTTHPRPSPGVNDPAVYKQGYAQDHKFDANAVFPIEEGRITEKTIQRGKGNHAI